jgi:hypothetical protein
MEQSCGPRAVEIVAGKHCDFNIYLVKSATAQSGACAEVQLPANGTVLWAPGSSNDSRKSLRLQHLSYQESDSSVCRIRRAAVSLLWNSVLVPWQ